MPSQPNIPDVDDWFRRLDAAWKRMPAEERTRQREEVQQHLEALVAAKAAEGQSSEDAWENALRQFGDPVQIGHKIYREWCQSRTGLCADLNAIMFALGLEVARYVIVILLCGQWFIRFYKPFDKLYTYRHGMIDSTSVVLLLTAYGGMVVTGIIIGKKFPLQAIKSSFYSDMLFSFCFWIYVFFSASRQSHGLFSELDQLSLTVAHTFLQHILWITVYIAVAYLASVTKRGWYRPTLDDFKLTLPQSRRRISQ